MSARLVALVLAAALALEAVGQQTPAAGPSSSSPPSGSAAPIATSSEADLAKQLSNPLAAPGSESSYALSDILFSAFFAPRETKSGWIWGVDGRRLGYFVDSPDIGPDRKIRVVFSILLPRGK